MNESWLQPYIAKMLEQYGDFPPPWIYASNSHPVSMGWRMGDGETFIMAFWRWWKKEAKSFNEKVAYFLKWPPPPRWCGWVAETIWDFEAELSDEEFDFSEYFAQMKSFGFEGTDQFHEDFNNESYD